MCPREGKREKKKEVKKAYMAVGRVDIRGEIYAREFFVEGFDENSKGNIAGIT